MYNLRQEYPKADPMNYIAKIIMNSLYGRFGMNIDFDTYEIIHKNDFDNFKKLNGANEIIRDYIDLDENLLVKCKAKPSNKHNVNVSISAAITAYSRIHMSYFKNNPNFTLFYSDTDSAYISGNLPLNMISSIELGWAPP